MAAYTIEDIELIRKKSGISYKEAVALLDYHNGNVARALVDLERNGRLKKDHLFEEERNHYEKDDGLFGKLSRQRILVKEGERVLIDLPLIFMGAVLLFSPHVLLVGAALALIKGCSVSIVQSKKKGEVDFSGMVKRAAHSVVNTVEQVAKEFSSVKKDQDKDQHGDDSRQDGSSFYSGNPAATTYSSSYNAYSDIPTIQVPVQVDSTEGRVTVDKDDHGSINVTVE